MIAECTTDPNWVEAVIYLGLFALCGLVFWMVFS